MSADLAKLNVVCDLRAFATGHRRGAEILALAVRVMRTPTGSYVFWSEVATRLRELRNCRRMASQDVLLDGLIGTFEAEAEGVLS